MNIGCPHCGAAADYPEERHGKAARCYRCQRRFIVPVPLAPPPVPKPEKKLSQGTPPKPATPVRQPDAVVVTRSHNAFSTGFQTTCGVITALFIVGIIIAIYGPAIGTVIEEVRRIVAEETAR